MKLGIPDPASKVQKKRKNKNPNPLSCLKSKKKAAKETLSRQVQGQIVPSEGKKRKRVRNRKKKTEINQWNKNRFSLIIDEKITVRVFVIENWLRLAWIVRPKFQRYLVLAWRHRNARNQSWSHFDKRHANHVIFVSIFLMKNATISSQESHISVAQKFLNPNICSMVANNKSMPLASIIINCRNKKLTRKIQILYRNHKPNWVAIGYWTW